MHIHSRLIAVLLGLVAGTASAATVDELISKNLEARGGLANIKALQSLRTTGKMQISGDGFSMEMAWSALTKQGGMRRTEVSLQGLTAVTAYDGKEAWQIQPFQGRRDPERLSADDAKPLAREADLEGPLVDSARKGVKVEYLGTEDVDGTDAHKLKVTFKDGDVQYLYLDPDHFLEIRVVTQTRFRGVEYVQESDLGNYEKVAGVYVPFSIETGPKGGSKNQKITIASAEPNVKLDDALFHLPASKPAEKTAAEVK
jgi:outer membrane lipoprotein-sorting protein